MSPPESLAIAELIIYPPLLLLTLLVIARHGIHRQSGWIYLSLFCLVRIAGAALGVAAARTPSDVSDLEWSAILGSVGISPLLLASLGLLKRITDETTDRVPREGTREGQSWFEIAMSYTILGRIFGKLGVHHVATSHRSRVLQLLQLPAAVALIICIVGGSDLASASPSDQRTGAKLIKAGLIVFLLIYICLFLLVAASARTLARLPPCDKRVLLALIAALPLLGLRILFGLLAYFSTISTFSPTDGSVVVRAFMAILEEMLIVVAYTLAGILVPADRDARGGDVEIGARRPKTGAGGLVQDAPRQGMRGVGRDGA